MSEDNAPLARWGWKSDLPHFYGEAPNVVRLSLAHFVRDAGPSQIRAWDDSIPWLQAECRELVQCDEGAKTYTAILEYELPREFRRPDVIILENGAVVVMELKGRSEPRQADLDQVTAYARDLRCYHRECADRPVIPVLVPTRSLAPTCDIDGVMVTSPGSLHQVLLDCTRGVTAPPVSVEAFLNPDAYAPLPSLVRAARDLFARQPLPMIKRAHAATEPAVRRITDIAHEAAASSTRHLVLLRGAPGSGKTLVGLRLVHDGFVDDLAVARGSAKPSAPAVFLSGNDPLVRVLQDALADAGGGGKVFVRPVKQYVKQYSQPRSPTPPEHLLIFDEAQRAWDAEHVARQHDIPPAEAHSEPELFINFANRIPSWCVIVGLIGTGQEIHAGEQSGLGQWRRAVEGCVNPEGWTIHAPADIEAVFAGTPVKTRWSPALNLNTQLRFHAARSLHDFVESFLAEGPTERVMTFGHSLWNDGYRLLVTRSLDDASNYARERFSGEPQARFGLLASSKAKGLESFGINNPYRWPSFPIGRWYNAPPDHPDSCCQLRECMSEFSSQGLELDLAVLAWGTDFLRIDGQWDARYSKSTNFVTDILGLRRNVYRVLLTRGREGTVIFVPPDARYEETYAALLSAGARALT